MNRVFCIFALELIKQGELQWSQDVVYIKYKSKLTNTDNSIQLTFSWYEAARGSGGNVRVHCNFRQRFMFHYKIFIRAAKELLRFTISVMRCRVFSYK